MKRICSICKTEKILQEFPNHKRDHQHGKDTRCKECVKEYSKNTRIARKTAPEKSEVCDCCSKKTTKLYFDHDHKTLKFRGWLCMDCNTGIGRLGDTLEGIEMAMNYLRRHNYERRTFR